MKVKHSKFLNNIDTKLLDVFKKIKQIILNYK